MQYIINSIFSSITYILPINKSHDCWLVDCGDVDKVIEQGWNIKGVFITHAHFDHIYGLNNLVEHFPNALIYTNEEGKAGLLNPRWNFSHYHEDVEDFVFSKPENIRIINDGDILHFDGLGDIVIIATQGHDPSCLSYKRGNDIFTGDSYIPGIKVVTNFPRSNKQQAQESLKKLLQIETNGCIVHCGHYTFNN